MVSFKDAASTFAPSPPLSASAGATDSEPDPHAIPPTKHKQEVGSASGQHLRGLRQSRTKARSPPSSTSGPFLSTPSPASDKKAQQERAPVRKNNGTLRRGRGDVGRALSLIKQSWQGLVPDDQCSEWVVLHISPSQYLELYRRLERHARVLDHFEEKLRSDYSPDRGVLVLRLMASAEHEIFQERLKQHILTQLVSTTAGGDVILSHLASSITSAGHTKLKLASEGQFPEKARARRSPDCQLLYDPPSPQDPGDQVGYRVTRYSIPFLIEVGYSQKANALRLLAQEYYEKSDTKTVLTVKFPYLDPFERKSTTEDRSIADRTAFFSLYRGPERIFKDTVFRDAGGNATTASFQLYLSDFIPDEVLDQLELSVRSQAQETAIHITAQTMCRLLRQAERMQDLWDATDSPPPPVPEPCQHNEARPQSRKRVHWEVHSGSDSDGEGNDDNDTNDSDGHKDDSEDGNFDEDKQASARSKRRRTEAGTGQLEDTHLPERRRTRSWTHEQGSLPERRRTRSWTRENEDIA